MQPYAAGTKVEKINSKPGDKHQDGALGELITHVGLLVTGTILDDGEIIRQDKYDYFVRWQDFQVPVFIRGCRIREVKT